MASIFQVQLQNVKQGLLDLDPTFADPNAYGAVGAPISISKQRQIWVCGPDKVYVLLKDGQVFEGSNYWKRFASPQVDLEFAFLNIQFDDGSVYSDIPRENIYTVGDTTSVLTTDFIDCVVNFANYGGAARSLRVQNLHGTKTVYGKLNGDAGITFMVPKSTTYVFNQGDLIISQFSLKNDVAGGTASWIASIRSDNKTEILV